jgi:hypothetical protein|tara:strand:+ start:41 stop:229 length:189 start_codon:yes stop_codon:yes gene_type:complete
MLNKQYDIAIWDIRFYKIDEEGNELQNLDGTVKLFELKQDADCSFIAEVTSEDDIEEINNES